MKTYQRLLIILLALSSCKEPVITGYQRQVPVPETQWSYTFQPEFTIHISDTGKRYQMYFLMRHDELFPTANIWFRMRVKAPGDTVFVPGPRIEKTLAEPSGQWLARGMGGIWEHKIPLGVEEAPAFKDTGIYVIRLEQIMRQNPLPSVINVGIALDPK